MVGVIRPEQIGFYEPPCFTIREITIRALKKAPGEAAKPDGTKETGRPEDANAVPVFGANARRL